MNGSALYHGDVMHRRHFPRPHQFRYRLTSWLIDIDQLAELDTELKGFGWNRRALFSFYDRDYGGADGRSPRQFIDQLCSHYQQPRPYQVKLLCQIRCFGHVFNPLAVWFCFDRDQQLYATVYEVRNTFGERHHYLVFDQTPPENGQYQHSSDKQLYVSPFMEMACRYHFKFHPPGQTLHLTIRQQQQEKPVLDAVWRGKHQQLTQRSLLQMLYRYPFNSLKVLTAIHWEALRLWLKGMRPVARPEPPKQNVTLGQVDERSL